MSFDRYLFLRVTRENGQHLYPPYWMIVPRSYRIDTKPALAVKYSLQTGRFDYMTSTQSYAVQPWGTTVDLWNFNDLPDHIAAAAMAWHHNPKRLEPCD